MIKQPRPLGASRKSAAMPRQEWRGALSDKENIRAKAALYFATAREEPPTATQLQASVRDVYFFAVAWNLQNTVHVHI